MASDALKTAQKREREREGGRERERERERERGVAGRLFLLMWSRAVYNAVGICKLLKTRSKAVFICFFLVCSF